MARLATPNDIPAISRVQVGSWDGVYRGLIPDDVIDRLNVEHRVIQWTAFFERADDREALLVAQHDHTVVGMASLGPARDEDLEGPVGEVRAIYVLPDHWDHGHGRDLISAGEAWLAEHGFEAAILWVLRANDRARRFYETAGWSLDGATKIEDIYGALLPEVRYRVALDRSV
ncbi:MAG: GNAT family N-acetyltransferase [Acidimicrobiia bacterium]